MDKTGSDLRCDRVCLSHRIPTRIPTAFTLNDGQGHTEHPENTLRLCSGQFKRIRLSTMASRPGNLAILLCTGWEIAGRHAQWHTGVECSIQAVEDCDLPNNIPISNAVRPVDSSSLSHLRVFCPTQPVETWQQMYAVDMSRTGAILDTAYRLPRKASIFVAQTLSEAEAKRRCQILQCALL